jgi:hypothetical protein
MVEQENRFTWMRAVRVKQQILRDKQSDSALILDTLCVLFREIPQRIPLDKLSSEIVPYMKLETAERAMLSAGFTTRAMGLSSLYHHRINNSFAEHNDAGNLDKDLFDARIEIMKTQLTFNQDSAEDWLKCAHNSGTNLAVDLYERGISSIGFINGVKEREKIIASKRELVPQEIRKLINVNPRFLNFLTSVK